MNNLIELYNVSLTSILVGGQFAILFFLFLIHKKTNKMATEEQFNAAIAKIEAGVATLKTKIEELKTEITGGGLPVEKEESVLAKLTAIGNSFDVVVEPGAELEVEPGVDQI